MTEERSERRGIRRWCSSDEKEEERKKNDCWRSDGRLWYSVERKTNKHYEDGIRNERRWVSGRGSNSDQEIQGTQETRT